MYFKMLNMTRASIHAMCGPLGAINPVIVMERGCAAWQKGKSDCTAQRVTFQAPLSPPCFNSPLERIVILLPKSRKGVFRETRLLPHPLQTIQREAFLFEKSKVVIGIETIEHPTILIYIIIQNIIY